MRSGTTTPLDVIVIHHSQDLVASVEHLTTNAIITLTTLFTLLAASVKGFTASLIFFAKVCLATHTVWY